MAVPAAVRSSVVSRDGTEIVYWTSGDGPPLVLVHGAPADNTRWRPLLPYIEGHVTVHAIDRRGRGASRDAGAYRLEREYEDVAAVIDAVAGIRLTCTATRTGRSWHLERRRSRRISADWSCMRGWPVPDPSIYALPAEVMERMNHLLAEGDRDGVVEALFRAVEDVSDEDMAALRSAPSWPGRVAAAHTLPREIAGETRARLEPVQAAKIRVAVMLMTGEESTDPAKTEVDAVAAALPDARLLVLARQQHIADILDPQTFAKHLLEFLHGRP